jgi:hypothetical protein
MKISGDIPAKVFRRGSLFKLELNMLSISGNNPDNKWRSGFIILPSIFTVSENGLLSKNLPLIAEVFLQADNGSIRLWLYLRKNLIMQGVQRLSSRPGYLSVK